MLLRGRERGKGPIGKIPGESPDKSGKTRENRERPNLKRTNFEGRTSPDRENPRLEPPVQLPLTRMTANRLSEAWGTPQFQEKRSRSEKAILGAFGEFRPPGILGPTLGIRNSALGIRNSILGMASRDLSNTKTTILRATPGAIPRIDGNPHERSPFAPSFSERFFENWGGPRAQEFGNFRTWE